MGLVDPVWMTSKEKKLPKALAAVEQMTGQSELAQVAIGAPLAVVADAAVGKVTDRDCLVGIAMGATCESARIAAMDRMDDQALDSFVHEAGRWLKKQGLYGYEEWQLSKRFHDGEKGLMLDLQDAALERIGGQETLMRIAGDSTCFRDALCQRARKRLDGEHRKRLVLTSPDADLVAEAIADGFDDEAFLREHVVQGARELPCLADKFESYKARAKDETVIEKLIVAALSQMRDEEFLFDVAMKQIEGPLDKDCDNGWTWPMIEAAVWHIADQEKLYRVVVGIFRMRGARSFEQIQGAAISRMHDETRLRLISEKYCDPQGYGNSPSNPGIMALKQLKSKGKGTFYRKLEGSDIRFEGSNWDRLDT